MLQAKEKYSTWSLTLVIICAILLHVINATAKESLVEEYHTDRKFTCSSKQTGTATNEIQCVHRCLRKENCSIANYKENTDGNPIIENCETFDDPSQQKKCSSEHSVGWKGLVLWRKTEPKVYKNCKDIATNVPHAVSGVYDLEDGRHFCRIEDVPSCGSGGWTLALKMNGSSANFAAKKDLWITNATFNIESGIKSFDVEEAKFNAYSMLSFNAVCIGFKYSGTTKWLRINQKGTSLLDIFKNGTYIPTSISRDVWKALIAGSSLQLNCNRQGFNMYDNSGEIRARIGYIGNEQNDCTTPDSFIALGSNDISECPQRTTKIYCGCASGCNADNGTKELPAMGFILVQ